MQYPVDIINIRQEFGNGHNGLDLGWDSRLDKNSNHQPIYAVEDGIVIYNRWQGSDSGGYVIHIYHPSLNLTSEYGHLEKDSQTILEGYEVKRGQMIAKMGDSGNAHGCHLHFGLYPGRGINYSVNRWLDPILYLSKYKHQTISGYSKAKLKIEFTKIALDIPSEPLLVHNKPNFDDSSVVKDYKIYNNDEVPFFGVVNDRYAIIDNYRKYYTSRKFLK